MKCKKHPRYKAIRSPKKSNCEYCWLQYLIKKYDLDEFEYDTEDNVEIVVAARQITDDRVYDIVAYKDFGEAEYVNVQQNFGIILKSGNVDYDYSANDDFMTELDSIIKTLNAGVVER